jgi:hypothetical protein
MRLLQCCKKKERKPREDGGICMLYFLARKLFGQDVGKESENKMKGEVVLVMAKEGKKLLPRQKKVLRTQI